MKSTSIFLIVIILALGLGSSYIYAAGRHHMTVEVKGEIDGMLSNQTCVNETVTIIIRNLNTGELLGRVYTNIYYNEEKIADLVTDDSGTVQFIPTKEGSYRISMEKSRYVGERTEIDVSVCVTTTTTTTSTTTTSTTTTSTTTTSTTSTTTTTTSTTTTSTTTTTTSTTTTSTTLPKETCSDGIQNQGEEGIDCGGPCNPCPSGDMQWLILAAVIIAGGIIVFMIRSGSKKEGISDEKIKKTREKELEGVDQEVNKVKKKKHHEKSEVKQEDREKVEEEGEIKEDIKELKKEEEMEGEEPGEKITGVKKKEGETVRKTRKKKTKSEKKDAGEKVKKTRKKKTKAKKRKTVKMGESEEKRGMKSKREGERKE